MSDIKLFRVGNNSASEIEGRSFTVERSLQTLIERHCETFLGVTFLASEHATGKTHAGRIDTLGKERAAENDWSASRQTCIAGDFIRYDEHAVQQINRNINLLRHCRFGP